MRFIGDVHGKFVQYQYIINDCDESIQLGDFGFGFKPIPEIKPNHKIIRGNHDCPELAFAHPNVIQDFTIFDCLDTKTVAIGGANSIDKYMRTIGIDWWDNEENSYESFMQFSYEYENVKPDIILSHTCPKSMIPWLFQTHHIDDSITQQYFDVLLEIHKPKLWIFGHWHKNVNKTILDTNYICLAELAFMDF